MGLKDALKLPEFNGLTDQQSLDLFTSTVSLPFDNQLYHWNGVTSALLAQGLDSALVVNMVSHLSSCPGWDVFDRCVSNGFDFSTDANRAIIQSLEISDPPEAVTLLEGMLSIGRPTALKWKAVGLTVEPQLSEITAARSSIAVADWWAQVRDELVPQMLTAGNSVSEIKAAIGAQQ